MRVSDLNNSTALCLALNVDYNMLCGHSHYTGSFECEVPLFTVLNFQVMLMMVIL